MNMFVVAVRDRAADVFGTPHFVLSIGGAVRAFTDEVNRVGPDSPFNKHPEDYDLYTLGVYHDDSGTFDCGIPRQIAVGKDLFVAK